MATRYSGKPCSDCGKPKGPNQADRMRCFRCQQRAKRCQGVNRHATHVEATFGLTGSEYNALRAYQAGRCAICCRATGARRRLAVDHDHKCSEGHAKNLGCRRCIRGLLCSVCNTYIGRVRDDPRVGDRMAHYLREPPWPAIRDEGQSGLALDNTLTE